MRKIGIIGGGAAGIAAAIAAARNDRHAGIFILEQKDKIGRKILATGNGRCNLTNRQIEGLCTDSCYHGEDVRFAKEVLEQFGYRDTLEFFSSLGLVTKMRGDYVYPRSDQASAVLELLKRELKRLKVAVHCGVRVQTITHDEKGFYIRTVKKNISQEESGNHQAFRADGIILACGGKAAPAFGSDGSGYQLARALGHSVTPVVPALVQLKVKNHPLSKASGVRTEARVTALIDGILSASDVGELQITAYGISGIPVFQISRHIAMGLYEKRRTEVLLDLLPEYSEKEVSELFTKMAESQTNPGIEDCLLGIFNQKLISGILEQAKVRPGTKMSELNGRQFWAAARKCKKIVLTIQDTNGFENAQVCAGGVRTEEVNPGTMESVRVKGLYFAGELLDIDGICGGYNLQWAWATGCIAGRAAVSVRRRKKDVNPYDTNQPD